MPQHASYGNATKSFHWLTALLIIGLIPLGLIANGLPYDTSEQLAQKALLFSIHKTLGVLVFFVALARIAWALTQAKPAPLHPDRKVETFAAETVHWALYISLVIVPLSGWINHAATEGFAPIWWPFGQNLPLVPKSEAVSHLFAGLHWVFGKVMVASLLLHIAGALKHHFIDRDATLRRMWFGKANVTAPAGHIRQKFAPIAAVAVIALATGAGALNGIFDQENAQATPQLETVASDWLVQSGEIAITVTQLGSPVTGAFADWTAAINFDPEATGVMGDVTTTINVGSLTLGSVTAQAMGPDFFDQTQFGTATFAAEITPDGGNYLAAGALTLKGQTVPVTLPFTLVIVEDTATIVGNLQLNRTDFGIGESMPDESSLGFEVDVAITLTASKAP